jgi:hypothetical protein
MFLRRFAQNSSVLGILIGLLVFTNSPAAQAAPILLINSIGTGCETGYIQAWIQTNRYVATKDVRISAINYLIGTQSTTNFSTSYLYIYSNNAATNYPLTVLDTFTPSALVGSGSSKVGKFIGSSSISAGTKFWIVPSVSANYLPWCNVQTKTALDFAINGIVPDTSTSNSNSSFRRANASVSSPPSTTGWSSTIDSALLWQLSIEAEPPAMNGTLSLSTNSNKATYRTQTTLNAIVESSARVTFFALTKPIPNCRNIASVGGIASCSWRPSVIGVNRITAKITAIDSNYSNGVAAPFEVLVTPRSNTR